jgi:hypothetical protein
MSLEAKVTRRCDICGRIINDEPYHSCQSLRSGKNEWGTEFPFMYQCVGDGVLPQYKSSNYKDVCKDCWAKMEVSQDLK